MRIVAATIIANASVGRISNNTSREQSVRELRNGETDGDAAGRERQPLRRDEPCQRARMCTERDANRELATPFGDAAA